MPVHQKERVVKVFNRSWKISKFDVLTGNYMALKMVSRLSGVAAGIFDGRLTDLSIIGLAITQNLGTMSKSEFSEILNECIHCIKEVQDVNGTPVDVLVRTPEGLWGVPGLDDNPVLVMGLVTHVLVFNLMDFFDVSALKELGKSFEGLIPSDALTSMSSRSDQ